MNKGKIKPSEQISNEIIKLLLQSENNSENVLNELIRMTVKKHIQLILFNLFSKKRHSSF